MQNHCNDLRSTFQIQKNVKIYDFKKCVQFLEAQGQLLYGVNFRTFPEDMEIIYKLIIYCIRDEENAKKLNLNLNKGLLISGPVGCGKTTLMNLCNLFSRRGYEFKIKPCREIAFEFGANGYESLNPYTNKSPLQKRLNPFCFDDLGSEKQIKHFGNDCNVMAEIILSRYDHYVENNTFTHITTNLSATELEDLYGNRVRSRMRNMFNLIAFASTSKDKR
ncbi:ATP-binding protein [Flavobacterium gawalongense]|uniref:ATPase n=1 Tax=Flavobacterium gawalongense TaxID=2594432 RepID=A0A553BDB7_9FLAO|nr:ATPase [Flavobacterium gawalongense]TRX01341.1 ATPase [Flavobacterium gawalongense]TRX05865.1 ATPase [Flavobacterium gawalongense]TRX06251.1 ATPase [Flavobacterium gawalongense]TRX06995.1 ATPase [Flavobacterium gawalongense]TRX23116.1 ATPase [Flavobacterium gawalongense]